MNNSLLSNINSIFEGIFVSNIKSFNLLKEYINIHTPEIESNEKCVLSPKGRLNIKLFFGNFMIDSTGYKEKITIKILKNTDNIIPSQYNNNDGFIDNNNVIIIDKFNQNITRIYNFIKPLFNNDTSTEIKRFFSFDKIFNANYFTYNNDIIGFNNELLTNKAYTFLGLRDINDMYKEWEDNKIELKQQISI